MSDFTEKFQAGAEAFFKGFSATHSVDQSFERFERHLGRRPTLADYNGFCRAWLYIHELHSLQAPEQVTEYRPRTEFSSGERVILQNAWVHAMEAQHPDVMDAMQREIDERQYNER